MLRYRFYVVMALFLRHVSHPPIKGTQECTLWYKAADIAIIVSSISSEFVLFYHKLVICL